MTSAHPPQTELSSLGLNKFNSLLLIDHVRWFKLRPQIISPLSDQNFKLQYKNNDKFAFYRKSKMSVRIREISRIVFLIFDND